MSADIERRRLAGPVREARAQPQAGLLLLSPRRRLDLAMLLGL